MKLKLYITMLWICLFVVSCGKDVVNQRNLVDFNLIFPKSLKQTSDKWENFMDHLDSIEVLIKGAYFDEKKIDILKGSSSSIQFSELDFPRDSKDKLELEVRVWEKDRYHKNSPLLIGKKTVAAGEVLKEGGKRSFDVYLRYQD